MSSAPLSASVDDVGLTKPLLRVVQNLWLWAAIITIFCAIRAFQGLDQFGTDTDDATRLVEVRNFLNGAGWYNLALPQLGGAAPLISHWSRLVDLPLAALIVLFNTFLPYAQAELVARIVWPPLVGFVFIGLLAREMDAIAGRFTAIVFLVLCATAAVAFQQFIPGRIDHHNMMILGTVVGLVRLSRIEDEPRAGLFAGVLIAFALAVGYEPIALIVAGLTVLTLMALWTPALRAGLAWFGLAFAATLALLFAVTVAPGAWLASRCDALSLNMVVLAAGAAASLSLLSKQPADAALPRLIGVLVAPAALALIAYGALEPKCLAGPFGQIDPGIVPIWLNGVSEVRSLRVLAENQLLAAASYMVLLAMGVAAAAWLGWRYHRSSAHFLAAVTILAALLGFWQVKLVSYALWLSCAVLALMLALVRRADPSSSRIFKLAGVLLCNQVTVFMMVTGLMVIFRGDAKVQQDLQMGACITNPVIDALAPLPQGLVAAHLDLGPFIIERTHHSAVAGPYHRLGPQIRTIHEIREGDITKAEALLRGTGAKYFAVCAAPTGAAAASTTPALEAHLLKGGSVPYLEEIDISDRTNKLRVWKILPQA